jgi:ferredoxin
MSTNYFKFGKIFSERPLPGKTSVVEAGLVSDNDLNMKKIVINAVSEKCAGCQICRLICSFTHEKIFNPSKSRIVIDFVDDGFSVGFTDECDKCGTCVEYCVYGALEKI